MSYGGVENTLEELDVLRGAKITHFEIVNEPFFGEQVLRMHVVFPKETQFEGGLGGIPMRMGVVEIWQDAEGNGPGFLAIRGTLADVVAADAADKEEASAA